VSHLSNVDLCLYQNRWATYTPSTAVLFNVAPYTDTVDQEGFGLGVKHYIDSQSSLFGDHTIRVRLPTG
jgi:hypothetical protein